MTNGQFPFIGRLDALNAFRSLLSIRQQKNVLYIEAGGGLGKTWLLRKIIGDYRAKPRWHVAPDSAGIDPIIDFFELNNRSIAGLRHSIIARLGWEHFDAFKKSEEKLMEAETRQGDIAGAEAVSTSAVAALRQQTDNLFFKDFKRATREINKLVVLVFDTYEVVHRRHVGRWFLQQFLLHLNTASCFIVFAGRPPSPTLPSRVFSIKLKPFTEEETFDYLNRRWQMPSQQDEACKLHMATGGKPLLIDMVVYTRNSGLAPLEELLDLPMEDLEWALIDRFARSAIGEHAAIIEMGYLKRRFDQRLFFARQSGSTPAYRAIPGYDVLVRSLQFDQSPSKAGLSSITKYRPGDEVLTLHDEVQRMIAQHAYSRGPKSPGRRQDWYDLVDELYQQIVRVWYPEAIKHAASPEEKGLLISERLGYELDHNSSEGLSLYQEYFEEVKSRRRLDLNELLWGEIVDRLEDEEGRHQFTDREYELCYAQADWLWSQNEFDAAAELYRLIVNKFAPEPSDAIHAIPKLQSLAALGFALMNLGRFEEAQRTFEDGLSLADQCGNRAWLSAFQQNMGQLFQNVNQWGEAEKWFHESVKTATRGTNKEILALASISLGRLQGLLGHYDEAVLNCQKAVALRQEILAFSESSAEDPADTYYLPAMIKSAGYFSVEGKQARLASAYLRLGEVYRYSGILNREIARQAYENALEYAPTTSEYRIRDEILQAMGNMFHDKGLEMQKSGQYADAIDLQIQAFDKLNEAIEVCRKHGGLERLRPLALHRMAHIVYAAGRLQQIDILDANSNLMKLSRRINAFLLPEETGHTDRLRESRPFAELDTIAKAQRLFEVSSLEAEELSLQDYNTSLDSLVQACEIALQRGRPEDLQSYARLAHVPGRGYQQELFLALIEMVLADLALVEGRFESALMRYSKKFPVIAQSGYGKHLLRDQLDRLSVWLVDDDNIPTEQRLKWCETLIKDWEGQGLGVSHPSLIAKMWEYRSVIISKLRK